MITIRKIAEMAGVAPATVSNVLHGRTSKLIGVIITYGKREIKNPAQDPFYGEMGGALEQEFRRIGPPWRTPDCPGRSTFSSRRWMRRAKDF